MAFKSNAAVVNNAPAQFRNQAASFLNASLPADTPSGKRKLGAFQLRIENVNEKELHDWLEKAAKEDAEQAAADRANGVTEPRPSKLESRLAKIKDQMILEWNPAERKAGTGFKLED